jgi:hypothetical protein
MYLIPIVLIIAAVFCHFTRRATLSKVRRVLLAAHRWFVNRGEPCTSLVFIAANRLTHLRFVHSESTGSYFEALRGYLVAYTSLLRSIPINTRSLA